jgi:hypothetical protein
MSPPRSWRGARRGARQRTPLPRRMQRGMQRRAGGAGSCCHLPAAALQRAGAGRPRPAPPSRTRRCFLRLPVAARAALVDTLTSNLASLATSADALLDEWDAAAPGAVAAHQAALKMHVFLLHCVATQAADEAERGEAPGGTGAAGRAGGGGAAARERGRGPARASHALHCSANLHAACTGARAGAAKAGKKKASAAGDDDDGPGGGGARWDWEWGRAAVLGSLRAAMAVDLRALYGSVAGAERMAGLALDMVRAAGGSGTGVGAQGCAPRGRLLAAQQEGEPST